MTEPNTAPPDTVLPDTVPPDTAKRRAAAFRATRDAHSTEIAEDYVELIGDLILEHGEARLTDLAEYMGVTQATAAKVVQRLKGLELVQNRPYRSLFLTPVGEGIAEASRRRHQRVVDEIDAEGIEHHVSDETLERMTLAAERLAAGA